MLASRVFDHGFEPQSGQPKTIKLVFAASQLGMQHYRARAKAVSE